MVLKPDCGTSCFCLSSVLLGRCCLHLQAPKRKLRKAVCTTSAHRHWFICLLTLSYFSEPIVISSHSVATEIRSVCFPACPVLHLQKQKNSLILFAAARVQQAHALKATQVPGPFTTGFSCSHARAHFLRMLENKVFSKRT